VRRARRHADFVALRQLTFTTLPNVSTKGGRRATKREQQESHI